jgi:hypothetical protein
MKTLTALSAYGRKTTQEDWDAGKDFKVYGGAYFSIRDSALLKADGVTTINFYSPQAFQNTPVFSIAL